MSDKELFLFTVLGGVFNLLVAAAFILPGTAVAIAQHATAPGNGHSMSLTEWVILFGFYVVSSFVTLFFNTALVAVAMEQMHGETPRMQDGFRVALANIDRIIIYALISATVGLIIAQIERYKLVGQIVGSILGAAWSVLTFLVLPVMIAEDCDPLTAIARSGGLLKQTWGEQVSGNIGMGFVFACLGVLAVVPLFLGFSSGTGTGMFIGVGLGVAYIAILALVSSALSQIFRAAVYLYAQMGTVPPGFDASMFNDAFRQQPSS